VRNILVVPLALVLVLGWSWNAPAAAATANLCGTLQALTRTDAQRQEGVGSATIDGRTYRLSSALSSNGTNIIGQGVAVGARVCLSGELVTGTDDLLNNYTITSCAAGSPAVGCVATLPLTATQDESLGVAGQLVLLLLAAGFSVIVRRRRIQRAA